MVLSYCTIRCVGYSRQQQVVIVYNPADIIVGRDKPYNVCAIHAAVRRRLRSVNPVKRRRLVPTTQENSNDKAIRNIHHQEQACQ